MQIEQVAAQTYTIREYLKTPAAIAKSLKRLRRIGYQAVQLSGLGPIATSELAKIVEDEGLVCCATHENGTTILENPRAVAEKLNMLRCSYTAYPFPAGVDLSSPRGVRGFTKSLEASGRALYEEGKLLAYHNHQVEFVRQRGATILDAIFAGTDPRYLQAEIDTYWVQYGGGNVESWCRKLSGRLPLLHMKDYAIGEGGAPRFAPVGSGNLEWQSIVAAAERAGCQWFIVEQDGDWQDNDPFKSLKMSFRWIRDNLAD